MRLDVRVLDDLRAIESGDPGDMLGAIASAGAQIRGGSAAAEKAGIALLASVDRPRAVVVAGMGGSAAAGEMLAALAGVGSPVPIVVHRDYGLPSWVGPDDLVLGVSCSGHTEETLTAVEEAGRRGAQLVTVGAAGSPLAQIGRAKGLHVAVEDGGRQPRACLWSLTVPLLLTGAAFGLVDADPATLEAAAAELDAVAERCRPSVDSARNPAKRLALHLAGGIPVVWGLSEIAGAAAHRFSCQLAENAKIPSMVGASSEPHHNQLVAFDGPLGRGAGRTGDQSDDLARRLQLRLVVLRDTEELPQVARRAVESRAVAIECGVPVTDLRADGELPIVRLASLVAVTDFASAYLALALGLDPTPVDPIVNLKRRLARPAVGSQRTS